MAEPSPIEVHKALADDTRYRLYRYLRLSGRPVSVRELSIRLGLHVNTLRPHLRRLEEAGLVTSEAQRGVASVGRPQTVYSVVEREEREGRDYRLFAEIVAGQVTGSRQRSRAVASAREWGAVPRGALGAEAGRSQLERPEPRGAAGSALRGRIRPAVPPSRARPGRHHAARLSLPRPARRASGPGVCPAPRTARGHARELAAADAPGFVRAPRRSLRRLSPLGRARMSIRDLRTYRLRRTTYTD